MARPSQTWVEIAESLRSFDAPAARAVGDLLAAAGERWESTVDVHSSMHDLVFTRPEDVYPWPEVVHVSWREGVFGFRLERDSMLVTADRCRVDRAREVLDAFLLQLEADIGYEFPTRRPEDGR
jgi:hypothetical protein